MKVGRAGGLLLALALVGCAAPATTGPPPLPVEPPPAPTWTLIPAVDDPSVTAPMRLAEGAPLGVPVGSLLVEEEVPPCAPDELALRLLLPDPRYRALDEPLAEAGAVGCLPRDRVALTSEVPPLDPTPILAVEAAWREAFPATPPPPIVQSHWDRVALPLVEILDADALAAEWEQQGLDTPERREKATAGLGPRDPASGVPIYSHFWGADPPGVDLWGEPRLVAALLRLSASWFDTCVPLAPAPDLCTLQLGDLAWPSPTEPDPLGHRDHKGQCVDIRLFRTDGAGYEAYYNQPDDRPGVEGGYDQARTIAFLRHAVATLDLGDLYFNDPAARAAVPQVRPLRKHDDHIHLCLPEKG